MKTRFLAAFSRNPKEAKIVGYLLSSYSELELEMCRCLTTILHGNRVMAITILFRLRGEENRLQILDAMVRPTFSDAGLLDEYKTVYAAANHARLIRNQYAHCHWDHKQKRGVLRFMRLESAAKNGMQKLNWHTTSLELLKYQESYFNLTLSALEYLSAELTARKVGGSSTHLAAMIPELTAPPLYIGWTK